MIRFMSKGGGAQPSDERSRPVALAGQDRATGHSAAEDAEAKFQALVATVRKRALAYDRHGMLSRYDEEDDHNKGSLLYDAVVFQDTTQLTDGGWLDRIETIARIEARVAAMKAEAIAGFDSAVHGVSADLGHRHPEPGDRDATPGERRWHAGDLRSVADETGLALQLHRGAATSRIHSSCELVHNFPATLHALTEGVLTERAAFSLISELSVIDDLDELRAAEAAMLKWAGEHPLHGIKQAARKEAARRCPDAIDKAHQKAHAERSVRMVSNDAGTADLIHTQDAVDAAAVMTSLSRAAARRRRLGDPRSFDQLRTDIALARLLPRTHRAAVGAADVPVAANSRDGGASSSDAPKSEGGSDAQDVIDDDTTVGAEASVVIHATGAEIQALLSGRAATGGDIDGHGPIPQNSLRKHLINILTRALLAGSPTTPKIGLRIIDDPPASHPDRYTPSSALDTHVRWRDRSCRFPGCNRPAEFADLDHRTAFAAGGRTTAANLHCLCRHHHRLKHEGGWRVTPNPDGSQTWTSPTGRRYRESPPDERAGPPS
jgi:hypothetical protein